MKSKTYQLGDICKFIDYRGKTPPKTTSGVPLVTAKIVKNGVIQKPQEFIAENFYDEWMRRGIPKKGSVVFTTEAPLGEVAQIKTNAKLAFAQRIIVLEPDQKYLDENYLFYALQDNVLKSRIDARASGTTVIGIKSAELKKVEIDVPPVSIQQKIAGVLSVIDSKIELNNKMNDNLEHQAQVMFAHIRQKFEDAPERCELVSLSDLMDYAGGSQPPASEFVSEKREGYVRFVQIRDYESNAHITYIPISKKNKLCQEDDIMIARYGASLGRICFGLNGAYNVALAKVFPRKSYYREFLRCYLSSKEFFEGINNKGGRSAQAGFNQSDIKSFELLFPKDDHYIADFENCASPLFNMRLYNLKENKKLQELRDTLLPKLMSGEIDVEDVKI